MSHDRKLESCEQGYPCPYMRIDDYKKGICTLGKCCVKHVVINDREFVYDELTGQLTEWTTIETPAKQERQKQTRKERKDDWYDEWLEKNGFGTYKDMMEHNEVGTHERHNGAKRQKRPR